MPLRFNSIYAPVRIIGDREFSGGAVRGPVGTGFFVKVGSERFPGVRYAHLVTAHHIWAKHGPDLEIEIANPYIEGQVSERIPIDARDWIHPLEQTDISVLPCFQASPDRFAPLMAISLEDQALKDRREFRHGATIHYIGLLTGHDRIMVRTGTLGAIDQHGMKLEGGYTQPVHLLDCRSYKGFSGSPCFLEVRFAGLRPVPPPDAYPDEEGSLGQLEDFAFLCGMLVNHLDAPSEDGIVSRYGVGVMLRVEEIQEALMSKKVRDERRKADERKDEDEPKFESTSVGSADEGERVSLAPLDPLEALKGLLATEPEEDTPKRSRKR